MRTYTTTHTVYTFDELSDSAKQSAVYNLYDINVDYDWWEGTCMDAEDIGLKINGFDIDRGSYVKADFLLSANEVAQNILNDHGEMCETYKTATNFMEEWQPVFDDYMNENSEGHGSFENDKKLDDLENEFLKSLSEDYRIMLSREYYYRTSDKAIIETIEANEYEFTENGKLV